MNASREGSQPEITVSVEKPITESLNKFAIQLWRDHRVCLQSVSFRWIASVGGDATVVGSEITTSSYVP